MGRKAVTDAQLSALTRYVAEHGPSDWSAAAVSCGLDPRTCRRAFERGLRGHRPIRDTLAQAQTLARSRLAADNLKAEAQAAPLLAASDLAEQAKREAAISRSVSTTVGALLEACANLPAKVTTIVESLADAEIKALPAGERAALARSVIAAVKDLANTATLAIDIERKRLGDPTATVRVEHTIVPAVVDAEHVAASLARALQRVKVINALPAVSTDEREAD